jgi:hypothetical protein
VEVKDTPSSLVPDSGTSVLVRRTITVTVLIIAGLAFAFGFSNGLAVGLALGVPAWGAVVVAPAVDLSVVTLLTTMQFLRVQGVVARLTGARMLLIVCGLITFALNTARPMLQQQYGRACFDGIAPLLLLGWSEVGSRLLGLLHTAVPSVLDTEDELSSAVPSMEDEGRAVPDEIGPSAELVTLARKLDAEHRASTGRPITRDKLRAQLKTSNAVASALIRLVRAGTTPPV